MAPSAEMVSHNTEDDEDSDLGIKNGPGITEHTQEQPQKEGATVEDGALQQGMQRLDLRF
ncbi:MAG: hypothetical protein MH213_15200 [Marinobacter sp.]|nr:hypothetical protein [Marinobacter sp.]